jgi:hypothetical protein
MSETLIFLATVFWLAMLLDCLSIERDRKAWLWIVLFFYFPGALIYFSQRSKSQSSPLRRLQLGQKLIGAKADAKNIGKAHQYLILGNILTELGQFDRARSAYDLALTKEPKNLYALWGAASLAFQEERFEIASRHLELLLKIDPRHLQGDASLLYAKVLFESKNWSAAKPYLKQDLLHWGHPESTIMLAKIEIQDGNGELARNLLQDMVSKVSNSPSYHYRRHKSIVMEARVMLKLIDSKLAALCKI